MPQSKRASLNEILGAAKAWLASYLEFPADRINVVVEAGRGGAVPKLAAERDIQVEAGGLVADLANRDRHDCRVLRELIVTVRTRAHRDKPDSDNYWMTDPERGSVTWEEAVIDALQLEWLENAGRDVLTYEPMYLLRTQPRRHADGDLSWGEVKLTFGLPIRLPLTQRG